MLAERSNGSDSVFSLWIGGILTVCLLLAFVVPTTGNAQAERTLRVGHLFPDPHYAESVQVQTFKELVEENSDGRLAVETYPGGQLVGGGDALEGVQNQVADVSIVIANFYPEEFIAAQVAVLPFMLDPEHTSMVGAQAIWRALHEPGPMREEWASKDLIPIGIFMTGRYEIFTKNRPVDSLDDLEGLSIRSAGGLMDSTLEAMGATPVGMPPSEQVPALERGTLDGTSTFWSSAEGHGLADVVDYATHGFLGFTGGFNPWVMSRSNFESLPEDLQQVVLEAGYESSLVTQRHIMEQEQELLEKYRNSDRLTVTDLSSDVRRDMEDQASGVYDEWMNVMEERGYDGEEVLEQFRRHLEQSLDSPDEWPRYYEQK